MSPQILNAEIIIALAIWFVPLLVLVTVIILAALSIFSEHRKGAVPRDNAKFKFNAVVATYMKFFPKRGTKDRK